MLSDIFPTGWHSTRLANLKPGESIVIYGAGPVGLMAAMSARIQGASQIFVVDGKTDRLALAEEIGATPIDTMNGEIGDQIRELTNGMGADCGSECIGYQCHNAKGKEIPQPRHELARRCGQNHWPYRRDRGFCPSGPLALRTRMQRRAKTPSTSASSGLKGKRWAPGRPMSKLTIAIFVTSFVTAKQIRL